jgi:hypothetical protein
VNARSKTAMLVLACAPAMVMLAACGHRSTDQRRGIAYMAKPLPRGVMSAHRACALVLRRPRGTFVGLKQVHLVLTTYGKGEPVESQGDYTTGNPRTLVWVVEVHAKAIHVDYSRPSNAHPIHPTDFSVVMNAKTGRVSDFGIGHAWPLPLWTVGKMISLPARC